jgi:hypothetical protein
MAHVGAERERAPDQSLRLVGIVGDERPREPGERRDQALDVPCSLRLPDSLRVRGLSERQVAADPVDLAELLEWVRDHPRPEPLVERPGRLEVGERLVEPPELGEGIAAIREGERLERCEPGEVRQPQGEIELRDRLRVGALLHMAGAPVRAHPDQLEDVARLLGVLERA